MDVEEGRHPCLDLPGSNYIANDTRIGGDGDGSSLIILTGPNMGGKSTLMRQTGLLVVLAQVISWFHFFIPQPLTSWQRTVADTTVRDFCAVVQRFGRPIGWKRGLPRYRYCRPLLGPAP